MYLGCLAYFMKHTANIRMVKRAISERNGARTEALDKEQINMIWKDFYSKEAQSSRAAVQVIPPAQSSAKNPDRGLSLFITEAAYEGEIELVQQGLRIRTALRTQLGFHLVTTHPQSPVNSAVHGLLFDQWRKGPAPAGWTSPLC